MGSQKVSEDRLMMVKEYSVGQSMQISSVPSRSEAEEILNMHIFSALFQVNKQTKETMEKKRIARLCLILLYGAPLQ